MAAHSGKGSANGSGANPALDADAADELAANFRPSWAADDDDDLPPALGQAAPAIDPAAAPAGAPAPAPSAQPAVSIAPVVTISNDAPAPSPAAVAAAAAAVGAAPVPAAPQTQKMMSPQTVLGMGSPIRSPEPSSEALDSQNVIEVAPAAKSLSTTQPMSNNAKAAVAAAAAAPASAASASAKPVNRNMARPAAAVDPFKASALDSDEFPPIRKSNKGVILGVVGVAIAVGLGLFLKFALSPDEPSATTTPAATTAKAKENDIPPPPPKEETPPAATTATATPPPVAKADPPPAATTADPPAKKADPPPIAKTPDPPRTVAAAPAKPPKQPPASTPPASPPKTPPKSTGGGIVRDSPF